MANRILIILAGLFIGSILNAAEINDVNGSWVNNYGAVEDSDAYDREYSWGMGKTIPNFSIDMDLGEKQIRFAGMGLYFIDSVTIDEEGSICLKIYSVGDENTNHNYITLKYSFIDYDKAYIICYHNYTGWWDRTLSPEEKWIWYRLSGPARD